MWESYYSVASLDEAVSLLAERPGIRRVVAGGTDLILELQRGLRPDVRELIDISRVPDQDQIALGQDGWIHLGPLVTHNQCAGSALLVERAFALARACWEVGAPQIRNRGTVCGNVVTGSPANDAIPPLLAFGAVLRLRSSRGERVVPLGEFHTGVRKTVLMPDEMVVDIAFPLPSAHAHSTFTKHGLRRAQAISVVNGAVLLQLDGGVVQRAAIAIGSVAPTVVRAHQAEAALVGQPLTAETIARAGTLAAQSARPIDDVRSSREYRRDMVRVSITRALGELMAGQEREGFPSQPVTLAGAGGHRPASRPGPRMVHGPDEPIRATVNGKQVSLGGNQKTLLRWLREEVGLTGTKEGCDEGECGACTVYLDGAAVMSCLVPAPRAHGAEIVTVEGLSRDGRAHPIQQAFVDRAAVQCGYCTPGLLMAGAKLLEERPNPQRADITQAIAGNLCRCTGYYSIVSAIERAAELVDAAAHGEQG